MGTDTARPVALVTGAAGDIGTATAVAFARRGYDLALFDRRVGPLERAVELCRTAGARVHAAEVDQTHYPLVQQGVANAVRALGRIDVLFANAGYGKFADLATQPLDEWQRHVDVNLNGTYYLAREVANAMIASGRPGSMVLNASSGATQFTARLGAYCVTKAAIRMLAVGLAVELGNHRIRVNAIEPGVVETAMTEPMLSGSSGPQHREVIERNTPAGRLGRPEDIAELVCFLSSPETAGFITGVGVPIDGGQTKLGHPQWFTSDFRVEGNPRWGVD